MGKQYLDKDGLEVVRDKIDEARQVAAGAMGLAQMANEKATDVYSTSEVKTNKVWINGKPIYRKLLTMAVRIENIPTDSRTSLETYLAETPANILALNIDDITFITKTGNNPTGFTFSLNSANGIVSVISNNADTTTLDVGYHILLEYTKTTN